VDWIIQYDPPDDPRDYIHRVGRTARAGKDGKGLLFLLPSEIGFLRFLQVAKVPVNEFQVPANKVVNIQGQVRTSILFWAPMSHLLTSQLETLLSKNYLLHNHAKDGYRSYLQAYASYSMKHIYNVNKLDLAKVAKSFGFTVPPKVNISVGTVKAKKTRGSDDEASGDEGEVKKAYYRNRTKRRDWVRFGFGECI